MGNSMWKINRRFYRF